ncbi:MAG TPA: HMG-box domain-containing protein [Candidatus Saccharimonadia bacterium]|nr:HMG-box domain-containing protein [Candidatus Saccharimonadia bacterium]
MSPDAWKALTEAEKDVWRARFREERRQIYEGGGHREHGDFQKGMIFWLAGDVYHGLKSLLWLAVVLFVTPVVIAAFLAANALVSWLLGL